MDTLKIQDKCRGSVVGGAVGDALGYKVEFSSLHDIQQEYGPQGITRYALDHRGVAHFSDDTQMSLFTAEGLMNGVEVRQTDATVDLISTVQQSYINWYHTQCSTPHRLPNSWLCHVSVLWARRAPGVTCLSSLQNLVAGYTLLNNSKGCGGVMRVAPVGLLGATHAERFALESVMRLAGAAAEVTHHHIASTLSAALMGGVVARCMLEEHVDRGLLTAIIHDCLFTLATCYPDQADARHGFASLILDAMELVDSDCTDTEGIEHLGEGWVGDEAIAIALFCVLRHIDDFEACVVAAVNHSGDSDSTGAIAGNIIGAILGYAAIPNHYTIPLEVAPVLLAVADDLMADMTDAEQRARIYQRYNKHLPEGIDAAYLIEGREKKV
jgi:ADP-ribosylglycohydrolase